MPSPGALLDDGTVDVDVAAARLGMVVCDDLRGITAYGPATLAGHTLTSAEAADPELLTAMGGRPFRLSSLRGRKIVLHARASY